MSRLTRSSRSAIPFPVLRTRSGLANLAIAGVGVVATSVLGAMASDPDSAWYAEIAKPAWQPPGIAFPIVWTGLYASIAGASASAVTALEADGRTKEKRSFWAALGVNLVLNAGWSWLFFDRHLMAPAAVEAGLLAVSSADLARRAGRVSKGRGLALVPYAAWTAFATVLTAEITRLNA